MPNGFSAETMAHQGWDSLTVDIQHGVVDYQAAVTMLTAISTTNTVPVVRVPWLDPGHLMKALDAGAYAVICPMINSAEDATNLVAWTKYPPLGTRSFGPIRGLLYGGPDYPEHANDTIVIFAMIETRQGLDNLEEILAVPGIDAVYVGPSDLSLALGCRPTFDDVDPPAAEAIELIVAKAREAGKIAGIHNGTPETALKRIAMGFQFVTISSDARLMASGSQQILSTMRSGIADDASAGY
ncbi:MAG: aldolase/citrate lyase family protein [Rhizobiaceae bacterium]